VLNRQNDGAGPHGPSPSGDSGAGGEPHPLGSAPTGVATLPGRPDSPPDRATAPPEQPLRRKLASPSGRGTFARFLESARFAWVGVLANKMRSLLTMLGIVIGVASVIALVGVGTGSSKAVQASIDRLGSNSLRVIPTATVAGSTGSGLLAQIKRTLGLKPGQDNNTHDHKSVLTMDDVAALVNNPMAPDVVAVSPTQVVTSAVATYGNSSHTISFLLGEAPNYLEIDNDTLLAGRNFTEEEYTGHRRLAILGTSVAADLTDGPPEDLVGTEVRLNGQPFRVVGILGPKGYTGQQDLDDKVVATGTAVADALYGYAPPGQGPLAAMAVEAASRDTVGKAQAEVQAVLAQRHPIGPQGPDFVVFNFSSVLSAGAEADRTLTILLGAVAGISLLVGGIGVMNIMLVSVTERTREIGIRKAIGGSRRDIIGQFLSEAVILSMFGGMLGICVGFIATRFDIVGVHPVVAPWSVWLALGVSFFTGLFFGFYPASRAADLAPIEALRYE
jgi:putative ABC transport system permease protein